MRKMRRLNSHSIDLIVKCSASGARSNSDSFLYESRWVHLTVTVSHIKWNAKPYISKLFMTFEIVYLYKCFLFISVHFSETYPETWEWSCASAQVTQVTLESLRKSARPSSSVNIQKNTFLSRFPSSEITHVLHLTHSCGVTGPQTHRRSLELSWWRPLHPTHDSNVLCRLWMNGHSQRLDNSDFSFLTRIICLKTSWCIWSQWAHCDVCQTVLSCGWG